MIIIFYVYEYYTVEENNVFYIGAGSKTRLFEQKRRNKIFQRYTSLNITSSRIYKKNLSKEEAIKIETERILELKKIGQAEANLRTKGAIPTMSEETKIKQSHSAENIIFTEKHRKNLSLSAGTNDPKVRAKISKSLKGRNYKNEHWKVTLINGSEIKFKNRIEIAEYFGVSRSLVNNWKYGTISVRWKKIIQKVEIMKGKLNERI